MQAMDSMTELSAVRLPPTVKCENNDDCALTQSRDYTVERLLSTEPPMMDERAAGGLLMSPSSRADDAMRSATPPFMLNFASPSTAAHPASVGSNDAHPSAFSSLSSQRLGHNIDVTASSPGLNMHQQQHGFASQQLPIGIAANLHQLSMHGEQARAELIKSAESALSHLSSVGGGSDAPPPLRSTVHAVDGEAPKRGARGSSLTASAMKRATVRPFTCHDCGKSFQNNSALMKHKLIHSDDRQFECHICRKAFKRQDHLSGHMNVHKSVKPFQCIMKECDKSYCDARSLRRHLEHGHSLANPQVHSQKGQMYVRYDDGKQHVQPMAMGGELSPTSSQRQHGGMFGGVTDDDSNHSGSPSAMSGGRAEAPVDCPQCGRTFKNTAALNGHMRLHSSVFRDRHVRCVATTVMTIEQSFTSDDATASPLLADVDVKSPRSSRVIRPTPSSSFALHASPYGAMPNALIGPTSANHVLLAQAVSHTNHQRHLQQQAAAAGSGYGGQFGGGPYDQRNNLLMMQHSPYGHQHSPSTSGGRGNELRVDLNTSDPNDMAVSAPATMLADAQANQAFDDRKMSMASTIGSPINVVDDDELHHLLSAPDCMHHGAGTSRQHLPDISNTLHDRQIANDAWAMENHQTDASTPERRRHLTEPWGRRMSTWDGYGYAPPPAFIDELDGMHGGQHLYVEQTNNTLTMEPSLAQHDDLLLHARPVTIDLHPHQRHISAGNLYGYGGGTDNRQTPPAHHPLQHANSVTNTAYTSATTINVTGRGRRCSRGKPENVMQLLKGIDLTPTRKTGKRKQSSGGGRRAVHRKHSVDTRQTHRSGPATIQSVLRKDRAVDYKKPSPLFLHHSQLRSPRQSLTGNSLDLINISAVPYTPPPMISPVRHGSGLFWRVNQALKLRTGVGQPPKSAPIDRCNDDFWASHHAADAPLHKMSTISIDVYAPPDKHSRRSAPNSGQSNASKTSVVMYHQQRVDDDTAQSKLSIADSAAGDIMYADVPQRKCRSTVDQPKWRRLMSDVDEEEDEHTIVNTHLNTLGMLGVDTDLDHVSPVTLEETPATDATPHINVGDAFQADIPDCAAHMPPRDRSDFDLASRNRPVQLFHPSCIERVTENELHQYLEFSCSAVVKGAARNKEFALQLLYETNGNVTAACKALLNPVSGLATNIARRCAFIDTDEWSADETSRFCVAMLEHDKDFQSVSMHVGSKSSAQCVGYFYSWKTGHRDDYKSLKRVRRQRAQQLIAEQQRQDAAIGQYNLRSAVNKADAATAISSVSSAASPSSSAAASSSESAAVTARVSERAPGGKPTAVVQFADEIDTARSPGRNRDGVFECQQCAKTFTKLKTFTAHERQHNR